MTPEELVSAACPIINGRGASYYFDAATVAKSKELGLNGFSFYFLGRGGVLGDTSAEVVSSAFGWWNPELVAKAWNDAKAIMSPAEGAAAYNEAAAAYGRANWSDIEGLEAFNEAASAIDDAANSAGLALYAGYETLPLADDAPARAVQLMARLREFRGSIHICSVLASGVDPAIAHFVARPDMNAVFGWGEDAPIVAEGIEAKMAEAEALTDKMVLPAYSAVDEAGADALMTTLNAIDAL